MLYMILTLVLVIIVLSATLLIFYKNRKAIKPKGEPTINTQQCFIFTAHIIPMHINFLEINPTLQLI